MDFLLKKPAYLSEVKFDDEVKFNSEKTSYNKLSATNAKEFALHRIGEEEEQYIGNKVQIVIIDATPGSLRNYYTAPYGSPEAEQKKIRCMSYDGVKPASHITQPVHHKCEGCPMAAFGSYSDKGVKGIACRKYKGAVVALKDQLDELYLMKINNKSGANTTYNPNPQALSEYYKQLKSFDVAPHAVVTDVKFKDRDHKNKPLNFPVLEFSPSAYLSEAELKKIQGIIDSGITKEMLGLNDPGYSGDVIAPTAFERPAEIADVAPSTFIAPPAPAVKPQPLQPVGRADVAPRAAAPAAKMQLAESTELDAATKSFMDMVDNV
jgi:hypothetical protein